MPHRGRKRARDAKYSVGIDLGAAEGDVSAMVVGHWEGGVYVLDSVTVIDPKVIEGEFVEIVPPLTQIDAGGSKP